MRRRYRAMIVILALPLLAGGCAPDAEEEPAEEAMEEYAEGVAEYADTIDYFSVRSWLIRGEEEVEGYGSYGYLLFTQSPADQDHERYSVACQAFVRLLDPVEEAASFARPNELMVTHWPLATQPSSDECHELIAKYDYLSAGRMASAVGKGGSKGPVLVAWPTPFRSRAGAADALVLDMSRYSDEDLSRAIMIWEDRIARDPSFWNDGFELTKIREELRSALLAHDEAILAIITSIWPSDQEAGSEPEPE